MRMARMVPAFIPREEFTLHHIGRLHRCQTRLPLIVHSLDVLYVGCKEKGLRLLNTDRSYRLHFFSCYHSNLFIVSYANAAEMVETEPIIVLYRTVHLCLWKLFSAHRRPYLPYAVRSRERRVGVSTIYRRTPHGTTPYHTIHDNHDPQQRTICLTKYCTNHSISMAPYNPPA